MAYRAQAIAKLRAHQRELKSAGILSLSVFGSDGRGEPGKDVDFMAEFDASKCLSLTDMVGLENRLATILGVPGDLSPAKTLKDPVRERAAREAIVAF